MKTGEMEGMRLLATDVADHVLPRVIVPPANERDPRQPLLLEVQQAPEIGIALATHWPKRPVLVDVSYIIGEYGRDKLSTWLPTMFDHARERQVRAIPVARLSDLGASESAAFRAAAASGEQVKFAIVASSQEIDAPDFRENLNTALERLKLSPSECSILADFSRSDFGDPMIVAPIIGAVLETLQDLGSWQHVIFQGTNFPEVNPAKKPGTVIWPRNEWLAWREAVRFDANTANHMTFGDYAADSSKISFGQSKALPIKHVRYATATSWLVFRAQDNGSSTFAMRELFRAIINHPEFAGDSFSAADAYIVNAARNAVGTGTPTTWRQLNTTHHITEVVSGLSKVRGFRIKVRGASSEEKQLALLP